MFGALKRGFRSKASLILVRNVVGELRPKRTLAASRGFLAAARLSCNSNIRHERFYVYLGYYAAVRSILASVVLRASVYMSVCPCVAVTLCLVFSAFELESTVSQCFAVLRQLRQIRHSVPTDTFQTLVVSLVLTRLNYGNSFLAGLPVYLVR